MNIQTQKFLQLPLLGAGAVALLISGIALASLGLSAQGFGGVIAPAMPSAAGAPQARAASGGEACAECGVIESTRRIESSADWSGVEAPVRTGLGGRGKSDPKNAGSYAITIRLRDGSMRVVTDANSALWRPGERVTLIAGAQ